MVKAGSWLPNNIYIYISLNLYTNSNFFSSNCAPYTFGLLTQLLTETNRKYDDNIHD